MTMTKKSYLAVVSLIFSFSALSIASDVIVLDHENYSELTDGKAVFIRFFAPWCGHSKRLAPHWDKLAVEYEDNEIGLIAEVDCTGEGRRLCEEQQIYEFPTIKYGDPTSLEEYEGGRSYEDLLLFATENLKPVCSVSNLERCTPEKKEQLNELMGMSDEQLEEAIKMARREIKEAETDFKYKVEDIQEVYRQHLKERDDKVAEIKSGGLDLMQSVRAYKKRVSSSGAKSQDEL